MSFDLDPVSWLRVRGAWGRRAIALGAGAASVLAMAPFFLWPVLFVTLGLLVLLIDETLRVAARRPALHAAMVGWWFGFGYFLAGLFWIGEAFLVEAEKFAVLMPFAVLVMPAGLALFWAAASAGASVVWRQGWRRVLALTIALAIAEWLRGHILTGFPWNVLGYALTAPGPFLQAASVLGIYGLTLIAVPIFAMPLAIWSDRRGTGSHRPAMMAMLASAAVLLLLYGAGALRLALVHPSSHANVRLRLVQPSIPQREKWQPEKQRDNFSKHLDLTRRKANGDIDEAKGITLVVWPEAAMPFAPLDQPAALSALSEVIPEGGKLAAGFLRIERLQDSDASARGRTRRIFNSLGIFGAGAQPLAIYDKTHLVPFGEYLPLQSALEAIGLEQLTRIRGGFDVGPTPRPLLKVPGLPALAPLICYEAIFPAKVIQTDERPAALLNVTNDGWFGDTTGPRQHFHQARVRAVEEGVPVIRSANNGISAVIDPLGRVLAKLDLDVVGTVDSELPEGLPPPPYARLGDALFFCGLIALMAWLALSKEQ